VGELGYMELDRRGAEMLFQVLTEREEKSSIAIASNESFSGLNQDLHRPPTLPPPSRVVNTAPWGRVGP
jgi:DNA replication protein DnaC